MKQHFISKFYLANFCDPATPEGHDSSLWVVDIQKGTVKRRAPKKVAIKPDYYSFVRTDGKRDRVVDEILDHAETAVAPVIRKIQCGDFKLTKDARVCLAYFMALFTTRVPLVRKFVEEKAGEAGAAMLRTAAVHPEYFKRSVEKAIGEVSEEEVERLRQGAFNPKNFIIRGTPEFSLALVVRQADAIWPIIFNMQWLFLGAPQGSRFLTTDVPVVWADPNQATPDAGAGLAMSNTILSFPITPRLCLLATWQPIKKSTDTPPHGVINDLNQRFVRFADRFIFSDNETTACAAFQMRKDMKRRGEKLGAPPYTLRILSEGEC